MGLWKGDESSMDESNFYERLDAAERRKKDHLQGMIQLYIQNEFVRLCDSNAFGGIELKAMEKIVSSDSLVVRSELDVVRAIVSWLKSMLEKQKGSDTSRSGSLETTMHASNDDPALKLIKYIRKDTMNVADFREMARLVQESKLSVLSQFCLYAFSKLPTMALNETSPIPPKRVKHLRKSNLASVTDPFYNIADWDEHGERQIGFLLQTHDDDVSLGSLGLIQLFASDLGQKKFHTSTEEACSSIRRCGGLKKFVSRKELCEKVLHWADRPVVFGVTVYATEY